MFSDSRSSTPNGKMNRAERWWVVLSGLFIAGLTVFVASLGDLTTAIPLFLTLFGFAFLCYGAAVLVFARAARRTCHRWMLIYVFVIAGLCRVACVGVTPSLSTDIYRYLWEGRVVNAGFNPFELPPDSPELEHLRDENYEPINHKHLETIYPPFAQFVFAAGAAIRSDVTTQKVIFVFFDLAVMAVLLVLLRATGRNPGLVVVYGWSPLIVVEFAHSGHMDSIGIFFMLAAVLLLTLKRAGSGVLTLAISFLSKFLAAALLPFLILRRRYALWLPLFLFVAVIGYIPFAGASSNLVSSLRVYGENWQFNSLLFHGIQRVVDRRDWIRMALLSILVLFSVYQARRQKDVLRYLYRVIGVAILLSPTVYPWYLSWLIPLLCFFPSPAWIAFSGLVVASYWVWVGFVDTGVWGLGVGLMAIEYIPFYLLLAREEFVAFKRRGVAGGA